MTLYTEDKKLFWIELALFFLALGLMTSASLVSVYEVLIWIPTLWLYVRGQYSFKFSKSSWCLIGLTVWGLISMAVNWSEIPDKVFALGELKFYFLGVFLIPPIHYFFENAPIKHIRFLFNLFLVTIILAFFVGIAKAWWGLDLVKMEWTEPTERSGGFYHIMRYGYGSGLIFVLLLSAFFNREKLKDYITPKLFYSALVFCFLAVFTSATRGALLGLIAATPFVIYRYYPKFAKWAVGIGGLTLVVILSGTFLYGEKSPLRIANLSGASTDVRVSQYQAGLMALQENPLFGLGPGQFGNHSVDIKTRHNIDYVDFISHTHNTFIEHAANLGFVGFLLFVLFIVFWFIEMISLKSAFGWAIACYLLAYIVSGQFELLFNFANSHLHFFVYTWAATLFFKNKSQPI